MNLSGKLIILTGASSGIGAASAIKLAREGAKLILIARNVEKLQAVKNAIESENGQAVYYSADLTNAKEVQKVADEILKEHGTPSILINSAGAGRWLSLDETSMDEFSDMIASPLLATSYVTKAFLKSMKERNSGHIISINSVGCYFAWPGSTGYLSARWALRGFMEALAEDLYKSNVKTTMISAGKVDSPYFTSNVGSADRIPKIGLMFTKTLSVEEVARVVYSATQSPKKNIIIPKMMAVFVYLNRFFPGVFKILMRRTTPDIN